MLARKRLHRATFALAGLYNLAWGAYAIARPQWLFRFAGMPESNHPEIFACLGMVVGLYGLVYFEVARDLEHGWKLAAIGLAGKILGPLGMLHLLVTHRWPPASAMLCITNDLIWWGPFALYLWDVRSMMVMLRNQRRL